MEADPKVPAPHQTQEELKVTGLDEMLTRSFARLQDNVQTVRLRLETRATEQAGQSRGETEIDAIERALRTKHEQYVSYLRDIENLRGQLEVMIEYGKTLNQLGSNPVDQTVFEGEKDKLDNMRKDVVVKLGAIISSPAGDKIFAEAEQELAQKKSLDETPL